MTRLVAILALTQFIGVGIAKDLPCAPGRYVSMCKVAGSCQTNTGGAWWQFTLRDDGRVCPVFSIPKEQLRGCKIRCGKLRQKRDGTLRVRWGKHCRYVRPNSDFNTFQKYRGVLASDCASMAGRLIEKCTCEGPRCGPGACDDGGHYPVTVTRGFCGDGIVDVGLDEPGPEQCEPGVLIPYVSDDGGIISRECKDPALACRPDCTCAAPQ
jgi:hypothetical protein